MKINEDTLERFVSIGESSICEEGIRNSYFTVLKNIKESSDTYKGMEAVVGFHNDGTSILWDMEKSNLLAAAFGGVSINYLSCTLPILSLVLRFSSDRFQFYCLTDDFYSLEAMFPEHCAGESLAYDKNRYEICGRIIDELQRRRHLNEKELMNEPFLLIAIGNPCGVSDALWQLMFSLIFTHGKRLRCSCMYMSSKFDRDPYFNFYKNAFDFCLLGECDEKHSIEFIGSTEASNPITMRSSPYFYKHNFYYMIHNEKTLISSPYVDVAACIEQTQFYKENFNSIKRYARKV